MRCDVTIHIFTVKLMLNIIPLKQEILHCNNNMWDFPGGLVIRILGFHCLGPGSVPGQGTEIFCKPCGMTRKRKTNINQSDRLFKKSFN